MLGKVFIGIIAVFLLLGAFSGEIIDGIKGWRTIDTTESFTVTTAAAVTTGNVTLGSDLYQDATAEVISITSNITAEAPIATSYTTATNMLFLSALDPDSTRTLTVNYYAETENDVIRAIGPFLSFLIIGGLLAAIAFGVVHKQKGR